jgi:hypothetical protein
MHTHGLHSIKNATPAGNSHLLPIARGLIQFSTFYVTFWDGAEKWVKRFYHPNAGSPNTVAEDDPEWNLTIGSERWLTFNVGYTQECFCRLRLATSTHR